MSLRAVMGPFVPLLLSLNYLGGQMGSENGKVTLKGCLQGFFSSLCEYDRHDGQSDF